VAPSFGGLTGKHQKTIKDKKLNSPLSILTELRWCFLLNVALTIVMGGIAIWGCMNNSPELEILFPALFAIVEGFDALAAIKTGKLWKEEN